MYSRLLDDLRELAQTAKDSKELLTVDPAYVLMLLDNLDELVEEADDLHLTVKELEQEVEDLVDTIEGLKEIEGG